MQPLSMLCLLLLSTVYSTEGKDCKAGENCEKTGAEISSIENNPQLTDETPKSRAYVQLGNGRIIWVPKKISDLSKLKRVPQFPKYRMGDPALSLEEEPDLSFLRADVAEVNAQEPKATTGDNDKGSKDLQGGSKGNFRILEDGENEGIPYDKFTANLRNIPITEAADKSRRSGKKKGAAKFEDIRDGFRGFLDQFMKTVKDNKIVQAGVNAAKNIKLPKFLKKEIEK